MSIILQVEVQGNKEVTDVFYREDITVLGKIEKQIYGLVASDGAINIPVDKVGVPAKLIANSTNAILTITHTTGTIVLPINGLLIWEFPSTLAITSIAVTTTSTQSVDVDVALMGV